MDYKSKTESELKKIAKDIYEGRIFTDRDIPETSNLGVSQIFLPLHFLDKKTLNRFIELEINMFYEYVSESSYAVNGLPTFMSFSTLNQEDCKRMLSYLDEYTSLQKCFEDA